MIFFHLFLGKEIPVIIEKLPKNIQVLKGEPLKLVAKIEGSPKAKVEWSKDGVPLKESEKMKLLKKPDGNVLLEINSANESDAGKYELKVSDAAGATTSSSDIVVNGIYCSLICALLIFGIKYSFKK